MKTESDIENRTSDSIADSMKNHRGRESVGYNAEMQRKWKECPKRPADVIREAPMEKPTSEADARTNFKSNGRKHQRTRACLPIQGQKYNSILTQSSM